jgi:hypothetical protein
LALHPRPPFNANSLIHPFTCEIIDFGIPAQ